MGGLWRKQFKFVSSNGRFIVANKKMSRLNHYKLKKYAIKVAPIHIYSSVLDFLQPNRVASKEISRRAYVVGGQFVIDIDHYMFYRPHSHRTEPEGFCYGCLENAKMLTLKVLDTVSENYNRITIVFSGKQGFHIHGRDFEVRDWTYYDERNPLKSHEVARRKYVELIREKIPQGFDIPHYILSCDVLRVITVPETLNGETGLICSSYNPSEFRLSSIQEIIEKAKRKKHITTGLNWITATAWKNPRFNLLRSP
jgi:DNA primase catalytic subunit